MAGAKRSGGGGARPPEGIGPQQCGQRSAVWPRKTEISAIRKRSRTKVVGRHAKLSCPMSAAPWSWLASSAD